MDGMGGRCVKYSIIKIPSKLAEEIDKLIEKMGFASRAEFVKYAVRRLIEEAAEG